MPALNGAVRAPAALHRLNTDMLRSLALALLAILLLPETASAASHDEVTTLVVDARGAPRRVLHARLVIPAHPGPLRLLYPKWIPGEHGPSGPIGSIAALTMRAGGRAIPWRRDPLDMYAFECDVPAGVDAVEVSFDFLDSSSLNPNVGGASLTNRLAILNWNNTLLYVAGVPVARQRYAASVLLPDGWSFATALVPVGGASSEGAHTFAPVPLDTLVDSPLLAGASFRRVPLDGDVELDLAADSDEALRVPPAWVTGLTRLVAEARALFDGAHFRHYRFLVALSDHVAQFGLEHHESSDNRIPERAFLDEDTERFWVRMLPHELVHSWNGKYRRPASQVTSDYERPRGTELLWVYEGLTSWLGDMLAVRSGLWDEGLLAGRIALFASDLEHRPGRAWRPLGDTAVAAQLPASLTMEWTARRRRRDYYTEGELLWLEVDARIRRNTGGLRSLDDFCARFFGGSGGPEVRPYSRDDLITALQSVAPFDWRRFFAERVDEPNASPPIAGIEAAGWRLAYGPERDRFTVLSDEASDSRDLTGSLGVVIDDDGYVVDLVPGSPADAAGISTGARVRAVDGRRFRLSRLLYAITSAASSPQPITLLVETDEYFEDKRVDYHGGLRFPRLERASATPDLLARTFAPRVGNSVAAVPSGGRDAKP